ncbi:MAG: organic hydroperoxide resistance protein, partial [Xanthomonadales bacterium]|jgi:Ohr subfamily peroxiredoxin|nr:organic hydroperoxide resistance protein [Xanthomonadales bacterium]MBP7623426.1 organic hydroperoxide resistance protein [Xanthomonadales bacterium]
MKVLYTAHATADGGRDGAVKSSDGMIDVKLNKPKALGGSEAPGTTNPEQLFASGYSACFAGAVAFVAAQKKVALNGIFVTAHVDIGLLEAGGLGLGAQLDVRLPGIDAAVAQELIEAAHQVCPYSKATRNNIDVKLSVVD